MSALDAPGAMTRRDDGRAVDFWLGVGRAGVFDTAGRCEYSRTQPVPPSVAGAVSVLGWEGLAWQTPSVHYVITSFP